MPTIAPRGSSANPACAFDTNASRGSSRARIAASSNPAGSATGTSFAECTAMSARPSSSAASSSFTNSPLPPIFASERSRISSPRVLKGRMSTRTRG